MRPLLWTLDMQMQCDLSPVLWCQVQVVLGDALSLHGAIRLAEQVLWDAVSTVLWGRVASESRVSTCLGWVPWLALPDTRDLLWIFLCDPWLCGLLP